MKCDDYESELFLHAIPCKRPYTIQTIFVVYSSRLGEILVIMKNTNLVDFFFFLFNKILFKFLFEAFLRLLSHFLCTILHICMSMHERCKYYLSERNFYVEFSLWSLRRYIIVHDGFILERKWQAFSSFIILHSSWFHWAAFSRAQTQFSISYTISLLFHMIPCAHSQQNITLE